MCLRKHIALLLAMSIITICIALIHESVHREAVITLDDALSGETELTVFRPAEDRLSLSVRYPMDGITLSANGSNAVPTGTVYGQSGKPFDGHIIVKVVRGDSTHLYRSVSKNTSLSYFEFQMIPCREDYDSSVQNQVPLPSGVVLRPGLNKLRVSLVESHRDLATAPAQIVVRPPVTLSSVERGYDFFWVFVIWPCVAMATCLYALALVAKNVNYLILTSEKHKSSGAMT